MKKTYLLIILIVMGSSPLLALDEDPQTEGWDSLRSILWKNINIGEPYEEQINLCDQMMVLAVNNQDVERQLQTERLHCEVFKRYGRSHLSFAKALRLNERYSEKQKLEYPRHYISFLQILGDGYKRIDSLELGIRFLHRAVQLDSNKNSGLRYELALRYAGVGKADSAIWLMNETIAAKDSPIEYIQLYNMRGLCYLKIGNYREAIDDFKSSIKFIEETGSRKALKPVIEGNIGACYKNLGELDDAYRYLTRDAEENMRLGNLLSVSSAEMMLAEIDSSRGNYQKAINRYETLLIFDQFQSPLNGKGDCFKSLNILYRKIGNESKSIEYGNLYDEFMASAELKQIAQQKNIENEINTANFETILRNITLEKENVENKLLVETTLRSYEASRTRYYLLIGALILMVLLLVFSRFRARIKRSLELTEAREQIAASKAELAEKNNELLKLQINESEVFVNQIRYELELKESFSKRLMDYIKKNDFDINSQNLNSLNLFIDNELGHKSILMDYSEDTNLSFVSALLSKHPNITETELSLIALIIQNYSNKEIAVSRSMTVGSVKVAKNRIKKKLDLTASDDLKTFLEKLILVEHKKTEL